MAKAINKWTVGVSAATGRPVTLARGGAGEVLANVVFAQTDGAALVQAGAAEAERRLAETFGAIVSQQSRAKLAGCELSLSGARQRQEQLDAEFRALVSGVQAYRVSNNGRAPISGPYSPDALGAARERQRQQEQQVGAAELALETARHELLPGADRAVEGMVQALDAEWRRLLVELAAAAGPILTQLAIVNEAMGRAKNSGEQAKAIRRLVFPAEQTAAKAAA